MEINLTRGKVAIVDDADAEMLSHYSWHAMPARHTWYAGTSINGHTTYMHRLLMGSPYRQQIDHKDGDGLNNKRENLRVATPTEQERNTPAKKKRATIHSKFKGVHWHVVKKKLANGDISIHGFWRATMWVGKKAIIKYSRNEEEAARLYDAMAKEHFGEFARLNFPAN